MSSLCLLVFLSLAAIPLLTNAQSCGSVTVKEVYYRNNCGGWWWWRRCSSQILYRMVSRPSTNCGCSAITIVSRAGWGARSPKSITALNRPLDKYVVHHTAGNTCADQTDCTTRVKSIQDFHMDDRGWDDIGYNFLIGGDGRVYEGRGWERQGAHSSSWNSRSYGISMIGSFGSHLPTAAALNALKNLMICGVELNNVASHFTLHGHKDTKATECPGSALYAEIGTWERYGGKLF